MAAYLPQARPLAWGISVQALVELGRFAKGPSPNAVFHALEQCGLTALANRRADALSGGELARAHLARALAAETPILVTDEPTAALDPRHAFLVMQLLAAHANAGAAVIAALHDLSLAARFATRIVVLKEGAVIADGPPPEALSAGTLRAAFGIDAQATKVDEAYALLVKGPS
jgi:iron complex transport system ATP-binding protein